MSAIEKNSILVTDSDLLDMIFNTSKTIISNEINTPSNNNEQLAICQQELGNNQNKTDISNIDLTNVTFFNMDSNLTFNYLNQVLEESKRMLFQINKKSNSKSKYILNNFVFVIPAYNSAKWVYRLFDSIYSQDYNKKKYRLLYVNDNSQDNTLEEINMYKENHLDMNIEIINNEERQWPAFSRYIACKKCKNNEICVFLDGDDWLINDSTLKILNKIYQNPEIQCTFGSMKNAPWQYKKWKHYTRAEINQDSSVYFPHLRTTRARVVKSIPSYYLQDKNYSWLKVCTDIALFISIIEAIGEKRYVFIKEELVYYNTYNASYNSKEGFNQSKNSDMRISYKNAIREKVPMKELDFYYLNKKIYG